ncbi:MAG: PilN domain-containing protein [Thiobacillus sp.]
MARLDFDFHARASRPGKPSMALAIIGVAALVWVWTNLQAARAVDAGLATQIAALEQARPHPTAKPAVPADVAAHSIQMHIAALLGYSWQPAFDALAVARSSKIALISLDAIQDKSQLKLVGEARQLADAIEFIEALQQQPGIRRAALTEHEVQADDPQHPVRFNILVGLDV